MKTNISRRNFLKGSIIGAAGAASASMLAACAPRSASTASASSSSTKATTDYAAKASDTRDCDIVVVGAGMSGLAAAVQALGDGHNVVVLEAQTAPGGNGNVTSVVMGVGTDMQKALGISLTPAQIISTEMETFNSSVDGSRWSTLVRSSKENIEWLIAQGAQFSGQVDNYKGAGVVDTGHWWVGDTQRDGGTAYVAPMAKRVTDLGGQLLTGTAGKELIKSSDGSIAGIYAESESGVIKFNCKAVILATGGYANDNDILAQKGYDTEAIAVSGTPGHYGDGISMALTAGAKSWIGKSSLMEYPMNPKLGRDSGGISRIANSLWVNGCGVRFCDENCSTKVPARAALAVRAQDISYDLFDQAILDEITAKTASTADLVAKGVAVGSIFKADTIAGLAKAAGIDEAALQNTFDTYNGYCTAGADEEFGKDAAKLKALTTAPYYLSQNNGISFLTTIGGIDTTDKCEVRADAGGIIKGLYAVGVDGVELYNGLYTIDIPGSCNANNINSGRTAAKQAAALL